MAFKLEDERLYFTVIMLCGIALLHGAEASQCVDEKKFRKSEIGIKKTRNF